MQTQKGLLQTTVTDKKILSEKSEYRQNIFYLRSMNSIHNEEPRTFIDVIPTDEPFFEAMTDRLKTFSKCIKYEENVSLKKKCLFGVWILMASKLYRKEHLPYRFQDWLYRLCKVERQASYNYKNLFKLMRVDPKLINCKINATYFVTNHETLLNYFKKLEIQTPWKHVFSSTCEDCITYFGVRATT